jgi:A/G-specific adenine glycosylase
VNLPHLKAIAAGAAAFYRSEGRMFPWRDERDLYRLAVAEILLQKTRASAALQVYESLISLYPGARHLAASDEIDLELLLRPLGLSVKRAAQLRGMAEAVLTHGEDILAKHGDCLALVPGLGAYGARAIACFGGDERIGIVDANVARIFRRVYAVPSRDTRAVVYQHIADDVAAVAEDASESNFGLLDMGAAICVRTPKCSQCPFAAFCQRYEVTRSV